MVIVEPVRNHSDSGLALWGAFSRWMSRVDGKAVSFHFGADSLGALLDEVDAVPQVRRSICAGRDVLAVLPGSAGEAARNAAEDGVCAKSS